MDGWFVLKIVFWALLGANLLVGILLLRAFVEQSICVARRRKAYDEERRRLDRMLAEMEASTPEGVHSWITYSGMFNELSSAPPAAEEIERLRAAITDKQMTLQEAKEYQRMKDRQRERGLSTSEGRIGCHGGGVG